MSEVTYGIYTPDDVEAIAAFWNESFGGMRNYVPIDAAALKSRVFENENAIETFDPKGFIIARSGGAVAGFVHAGVRGETFCRVAYPGWKGGSEDYLGIICVAPAFRRRGIGTELFERAKKYAYGVSRFVIDGQCLNPFWGNSDGPQPPLWGTTEGISVPAGDAATEAFFGKLGYKKRYTGVSLELDLGAYEAVETEVPEGYALFASDKTMPVLGTEATSGMAHDKPLDFQAMSLAAQNKTAAVASSYPMAGKKEAIYEVNVQEEHQGKGLGKYLVSALLESMKKRGAKICEVLTVPGLSPRGLDFYKSFGFGEVARWEIY
jgi:ribosomal protein S18 acetylase RimI-like enzyme